MLAVADGSGGQGEEGRIFARRLLATIKKAVDADPAVRLAEVLAGSLRYEAGAGASTATVVGFAHGRRDRLAAVTLGSSRYLIIRPTPGNADKKYEFIFRSPPSDQKCGPAHRGTERAAHVAVHDI